MEECGNGTIEQQGIDLQQRIKQIRKRNEKKVKIKTLKKTIWKKHNKTCVKYKKKNTKKQNQTRESFPILSS
jgi:hypothetical protein